jgi:pimeloyl-ACP methyl ester carboxylesterase
MIPSSNAQSYANVLAVSETMLLPNLGHLLQEEQPDVAVRFVTDFLKSTLKHTN